jgi:type 1 glutamine amidotransferase
VVPAMGAEPAKSEELLKKEEQAKKETEAKRAAEADKRKADAAKRVEQNKAKIDAALPEKAAATPSKPRKVLIYTKALGFVHDSIPLGAYAFEAMGKKTGAYESVVTDDPMLFEADSLKNFDAVILVSTTGEQFGKDKNTNERLRKSFTDWVKAGHGVAGVHAATDAGYQWKDYGDMMGAYFREHPFGNIVAKNEDPTSPINAAFKGEDFKYGDEIYIYRDQPYSRANLHVLLSIDMKKSGLEGKDNGKRADHDYAVSWIKKYGEGRVFYTLYGHKNETWFQPVLIQHMLAGVQFATGDLPADTTPSAKGAAQAAK